MKTTKHDESIINIKYTLIIIGLLILLVFLLYSWIYYKMADAKKYINQSGDIVLNLPEEEKIIYLKDLESFKKVKYTYSFNISNYKKQNNTFKLYIDDVALDNNETRIDSKYINYKIIKNNTSTSLNKLSNLGDSPNRIIDSSYISEDTTTAYKIEFSLNDQAIIKKSDVIKLKLRILEDN